MGFGCPADRQAARFPLDGDAGSLGSARAVQEGDAQETFSFY